VVSHAFDHAHDSEHSRFGTGLYLPQSSAAPRQRAVQVRYQYGRFSLAAYVSKEETLLPSTAEHGRTIDDPDHAQTVFQVPLRTVTRFRYLAETRAPMFLEVDEHFERTTVAPITHYAMSLLGDNIQRKMLRSGRGRFDLLLEVDATPVRALLREAAPHAGRDRYTTHAISWRDGVPFLPTWSCA